MFRGKLDEIEIEKIRSRAQLKLAMIEKSSAATLRKVVTNSGETAIVQLSGLKSIRQEKRGAYYGAGSERDTILLTYLDESWERLDMLVSDFEAQIQEERSRVLS